MAAKGEDEGTARVCSMGTQRGALAVGEVQQPPAPSVAKAYAERLAAL